MWVKCQKSKGCIEACVHKTTHDSDWYLSNCAEIEGICKGTGEVVKCIPVDIEKIKEEDKKKQPFIVNVREVYIQSYLVMAETEEEAIRIVEDGGGDLMEGRLEYSHTLNSDTWTIERPWGIY